MTELRPADQIRVVLWQFLGLLCGVSAALLLYSAARGGHWSLGILGCMNGAGAVLFFRRRKSFGVAREKGSTAGR